MRIIEDFAVQIPQGRHRKDDYVEMRHGTEYSIKCANRSSSRCDAEISVDGQAIGVWRIEAYGSITIERPVDAQRKLTFYKLGTPESQKAGLVSDSNLGLISVRFMPELETWRPEPDVYRGSRGAVDKGGGFFGEPNLEFSSRGGSKGLSAGGTGLGASSSQRFGTAESIVRDPSRETQINLRLVCIDEPDIIPLKRSNPVPPPVA